ncbi:MAG: hypothetical protein DM484_26320 [Candidatus Methylumidiphilus alinenensis]|uniref:DUF4276 domain-containing protein n=1 Tax=Candidatus Methylumidiphilus alinenensis TaxID=2202197 RepID=A0A2W4QM38_9GAMM|nr:MAG: hypothetical protein DM484_26320 [Candidatus Methylumidiphilus alinenensis]
MTISVDVVVLCEDLQMFYFIKHFLKSNGWDKKGLKTNFRPKFTGEGSGEEYVRERYPNELKALRSIRQLKKVALIVCTDADKQTVEQRKKSLDKECEKKGIPKRQEEEDVLVLVPKRNIETWFTYLRGENIDEENDKKTYNKYECESECIPDILELTKMCNKKSLRLPAPPSLEVACTEYEKLNRFKQGLN